MTPEDTIFRAQEAKRILDNDLVKGAFDAIEQEVIREWEACPARDVQGREWLWMFYKNTRKFRDIFKGYIEQGKIAEHDIKLKQSPVEKMYNALRR